MEVSMMVPNSWRVYFMENTIEIWMTGGTPNDSLGVPPMTQETPNMTGRLSPRAGAELIPGRPRL